MSEALFLVNPRKKRRKGRKSRKGRMPAGLRRYWASKRRGTKTVKRRRKRRHSAVAVAPRRRRRHRRHAVAVKRRRKRNPIMRRRHHRRRSNPFSIRGVSHSVMPAAIGATGAIALDVAYAYAGKYLPASLQTGFLPVLVKAAGAIGLGMLARKVVSRDKANAATLGALTVVAYGAIKPLIAQFAPTIPGLSGYADFVNYGTSMAGMGAYFNPGGSQIPQNLRGLGFYNPAATLGSYMSQGSSMVPANLRGLGIRAGESAYSGVAGMGEMTQPSWMSDGM